MRHKDLADPAPVQPDLEHNTPAALQRFALPTAVTTVINKTFSDPLYQPAFRSLTYTQSGPETCLV
ncbi:hypothetical protein [Leclercia sp.]|uniref:hypothetical protein n=1 Tax=Leclercia sp. TaxID=1898428 RepID=UPI002FDEA058